MLFRIQPNLPAGDYNTYAYKRKSDTVFAATCQQVGCEAYAHGWECHIDESTDLGKAQAHYIRHESGRTFKEGKTAADITVFRFEPYQRCFADHKTVAESFAVLHGDWRENKGVVRRHVNGRDWAEDFGEHQEKLADRIEKG